MSEDTNIDKILDERASTYGSFRDVSAVAQTFKVLARTFIEKHDTDLEVDHAEALDMIFSKIARIINGDPNYVDSWVDIAGYAQLVADRLQGKVR